MSLKSIWNSIKVALGIMPKHIEQYASQALEVTQGIKKALSNPLATVITSIIPGTWDNELKYKMEKALETVIPSLQIIEDCKGKPFDEMLKCWVNNLSKLPPSVQAAILQKTQALLTAIQDGKNEKQNLYDLVSQYVYSNVSRKND